MKLISPLPKRRGRLEIIPLIDIMFFLLAAFMIVSLNKIKVKSLKVNLPTDVPTAQLEKKEDFLSLSINQEGQIQIEKELIPNKDALLPRLQQLYAQNKEQKFLISADQEARHGDVIAVLGKLRAAGFQHVGFSLKGDGLGAKPDRSPIPGPPSSAPTAPSTPPALAPQPVAPQAPS